MLVIQVCTFLVFWLKLNFLCVLVKLKMLGQTVSCFLEVWEPITNSLNSKPIFSTYFTKHVQTHNYSTRNAQDYSINKTKKMFSDCAIRNCGPTFWNSLDKTVKHCKTTKHFRNQLKSVIWILLTLFWGMSCVFLCTLSIHAICKCNFFFFFCKFLYYLCWNLCYGHDFSQAFVAFWSCPQYHVVFFMPICFDVWYWNKVWYDMIYDRSLALKKQNKTKTVSPNVDLPCQ